MPPDTNGRAPGGGPVEAHEMRAQLPARPSHEPSTTPRPQDHARRMLELAGPYLQGVLADVEVIVDKAAARAREIPDQPQLAREVVALRVMVAELTVRVAVLELDLEERDAERRRQRKREPAR